MADVVKIGTAVSRAGTRSTGWLKAGELDQLGFARGELSIPVILANGKKPGPTLMLIAGQHPGEYVGMYTAIQVPSSIDLLQLSGCIAAMPILNPYGVKSKMPYVCPFDGLNLNRLWPGLQGGTVGQRTAYAVWNQALAHADFVIDLHGGDFPEYQVDYAIHFVTGNDGIDGMSKAMAQHFLAPYIRRSPEAEGGNQTGPAARMAMQLLRIPAIVTEVGDAGSVNAKRVTLNVEGIMNILRLLKMIPGDPTPPSPEQKEMVSRTPVFCPQSGLSRLVVEIGQSVQEGEAIAVLMDSLGRELEVVGSPCTGDIVQLFYQGWMNEGEIIAKIAGLARRATGQE